MKSIGQITKEVGKGIIDVPVLGFMGLCGAAYIITSPLALDYNPNPKVEPSFEIHDFLLDRIYDCYHFLKGKSNS